MVGKPKSPAIARNKIFCVKNVDFLPNHKVFSVIKPSKMEVAPLHRTVDITQKRVLFKNTKKTKKGY